MKAPLADGITLFSLRLSLLCSITCALRVTGRLPAHAHCENPLRTAEKLQILDTSFIRE